MFFILKESMSCDLNQLLAFSTYFDIIYKNFDYISTSLFYLQQSRDDPWNQYPEDPGRGVILSI